MRLVDVFYDRLRDDDVEVHRALARLTPLTSREFDRWVTLFHTTVDDLFSGAHAKTSAARIAVILRHHIGLPVVVLPLISTARLRAEAGEHG